MINELCHENRSGFGAPNLTMAEHICEIKKEQGDQVRSLEMTMLALLKL